MTTSDDNVWRCPACNTNTNSQGNLLSGCRAVALHVAGKIRVGDQTHRKWALNTVGDIINDSYVRSSINNLADELEQPVLKENEKRLREERERLQQLIKEQKVEEEPEVVAFKHLRWIETGLHQCVRKTLQDNYGDDEENWWVQGVPISVREDCAKIREHALSREELFNYTNLIHLSKIIERNWRLFEVGHRTVRDDLESKNDFLEHLTKINEIRNRVMHPVHTLAKDEDITFLEMSRDIITRFTQAHSED